MDALDLINRTLAMPMTHVVVSLHDGGFTRRHETRSAAAAENYAIGERRKLGKALIHRNEDLTAGPTRTLISVTVEELAK